MDTDWTLIGAAVATFLALLANIFSALGAARSADVAVQAEKRISFAERSATKRELQRTAAQIDVQACVTLEVLDMAARTATANASFYSNRAASPHARAQTEIQQHSDRVKNLSNFGSNAAQLLVGSDEEISKLQRDLDRTLIELTGERDWALARATGLSKANDQLSNDLGIEESAKGIYQRRDVDGRLI